MPVPAGRVRHATPGKHRGLQPPTIAQLHEETRVMREAVMKGGERLTSASCGRWSSDRISSVEHTACFTDTTRNRQRAGEGVLELPGATAVTHRPHNRLQESQQRAVPPHHGWLVVHFPVHARINHDFGKCGDGDHGLRHCW